MLLGGVPDDEYRFANTTESGSVIGEHLGVSLVAGRLPIGSRLADPAARQATASQVEVFHRREVGDHRQS